MTKIPSKPIKKKTKRPRNLKNDRNTLKTYKALMDIDFL